MCGRKGGREEGGWREGKSECVRKGMREQGYREKWRGCRRKGWFCIICV